MSRVWIYVVGATLAGWFSTMPTHSFAENAEKAALASRLTNASERSSLDNPSLKPWHLKLAVQLYDSTRKVSAKQGLIEEWWTPDQDKRTYNSPSYSATELRTHDGMYRTKGQPSAPYLLNAIREKIVHPMAPADEIKYSDLHLSVKTLGTVKLNCITLDSPTMSPNVPTVGVYPAFCLAEGRDVLRLSTRLGSQATTFNSLGTFQGREVALDAAISANGAPLISAHVAVLESKVPDAALFEKSNDLESQAAAPVQFDEGKVRGNILVKVPPIYPSDAKREHVSGDVLLHAVIGVSGHIQKLDVVYAPERSLATSALSAVQQWVYKPYLINGVAVEVDTTIVVHYNFGN